MSALTKEETLAVKKSLEFIDLALDNLDDAATLLDSVGKVDVADSLLTQYENIRYSRRLVKDLTR